MHFCWRQYSLNASGLTSCSFQALGKKNRRDVSWSCEAAAFINWHTVTYTAHLLPDSHLTADLFLRSARIQCHFSTDRTHITHTLGTNIWKGLNLMQLDLVRGIFRHISPQPGGFFTSNWLRLDLKPFKYLQPKSSWPRSNPLRITTTRV